MEKKKNTGVAKVIFDGFIGETGSGLIEEAD